MVTNKTDIVRFQRFVHHLRMWESLGHRTIFKNFCVVTYRTGVDQLLYMMMADVRPDICKTRHWLMILSKNVRFQRFVKTGEFDNRLGTGRSLRIFPCVVTYRTGARRRLYMITSADTRSGNVRHRTVLCRCCKRLSWHRPVPSRFCRDEIICHVQ